MHATAHAKRATGPVSKSPRPKAGPELYPSDRQRLEEVKATIRMLSRTAANLYQEAARAQDEEDDSLALLHELAGILAAQAAHIRQLVELLPGGSAS
jgi:hypothetical protein